MFALKDGKLYLEVDNHLVGVNIRSGRVETLADVVIEPNGEEQRLTITEVHMKFQTMEHDYKFPLDTKVEVVHNDNGEKIEPPKTTTRNGRNSKR